MRVAAKSTITYLFAFSFATGAVAPGCAPRAPAAMIIVKAASWGYAAERVDVGQDVAEYCDHKTSCRFRVVNESFPGKADPSPGNDKGLIVSWKCGEFEHKYQFAQGKIAKLDCD